MSLEGNREQWEQSITGQIVDLENVSCEMNGDEGRARLAQEVVKTPAPPSDVSCLDTDASQVGVNDVLARLLRLYVLP